MIALALAFSEPDARGERSQPVPLHVAGARGKIGRKFEGSYAAAFRGKEQSWPSGFMGRSGGGTGVNQKLTGEAIRAAVRMAADRGIDVDEDALVRAVLAVTGTCNGQDDPEEIAEDALELLGKGVEPSGSRRGRRPF
ncbi:MAG: hypothetical protein ACM3NE_09605 [Hyphomicrobiales bacterium]